MYVACKRIYYFKNHTEKKKTIFTQFYNYKGTPGNIELNVKFKVERLKHYFLSKLNPIIFNFEFIYSTGDVQ